MNRTARFVVDHYLVVPIGCILAMVWANAASESYFAFAHSWAVAVNDVGMTLFFALVMQEILETMEPGGALGTWRRWMLPIVAAAGGLIASVVLYLGYLQYVDEIMLGQAWPCAGAIDVVLSYFLARIIFRDRSGVAFTLLLAVTTDIVVLAVVAVRYPEADSYAIGSLLIAIALATAFLFRRLGMRTVWPYLLVSGPLCWWGFVQAGLQPALALIPIVPFMRHSPRNLDLFAEEPRGVHASSTHLERILMYPVQVALFFFALVNSGVQLESFEPGTWALPLAALIGRPAGIMAAVALALAAGFRKPLHSEWRDLLVIGLIVSTGFSFALFVATGILPIGSLLTQMKMGALSTVVGVALTFIAARALHVGRFRNAAHTRPAH